MLFAGPERGADRAAIMFTLIMTESRLHEVPPWEWRKLRLQVAA